MNIVEIVKKSFLDLKGYWNIAIVACFLLSAISFVLPYNKNLGLLLLLVLTGPLKFGISKIALLILDKKEISLVTTFDGFKFFKNSLGVFLLSLVFTALGFICFIIPGIIIMIWLSQSFFILVENPTLEPLDIFKKSKDMMKGNEVNYFLLFLFFTLLNLILVLSNLFFLSIIIAPIQYVSFAIFYKKLKMP